MTFHGWLGVKNIKYLSTSWYFGARDVFLCEDACVRWDSKVCFGPILFDSSLMQHRVFHRQKRLIFNRVCDKTTTGTYIKCLCDKSVIHTLLELCFLYLLSGLLLYRLAVWIINLFMKQNIHTLYWCTMSNSTSVIVLKCDNSFFVLVILLNTDVVPSLLVLVACFCFYSCE